MDSKWMIVATLWLMSTLVPQARCYSFLQVDDSSGDISSLGISCSSWRDCRVPNSYCDQWSKTCHCNSFYFLAYTARGQRPACLNESRHFEKCLLEEQCAFWDPLSTCKDGRCQCLHGTEYIRGECVSKKAEKAVIAESSGCSTRDSTSWVVFQEQMTSVLSQPYNSWQAEEDAVWLALDQLELHALALAINQYKCHYQLEADAAIDDLGVKCKSTSDCKIPKAYCDRYDQSCYCSEPYYIAFTSPTVKKCLNESRYNEPCELDDQCFFWDENSICSNRRCQCDASATLVKGRCTPRNSGQKPVLHDIIQKRSILEENLMPLDTNPDYLMSVEDYGDVDFEETLISTDAEPTVLTTTSTSEEDTSGSGSEDVATGTDLGDVDFKDYTAEEEELEQVTEATTSFEIEPMEELRRRKRGLWRSVRKAVKNFKKGVQYRNHR